MGRTVRTLGRTAREALEVYCLSEVLGKVREKTLSGGQSAGLRRTVRN
jgi:hypothetical protein